MGVFRVFSWAMLFLGLYYVGLAVFFAFPKTRGVTLGKLDSTKHKKNVRMRNTPYKSHETVVVPHYTRFVYTYTVAGKTYRISGAARKTPKQLPYSPRIVYLKKCPRYAFASELTVFQRPFWGAFLIFLSVIFFVVT